jgi:predicted MFS family arabinose efflux permease
LAIGGIVLLGAFIWQERRIDEAIIPPKLWRNPVFSVATGLEFLVGFAMFGAIIFLPLYLQTVGGASATNSGLLILPLMAGVMTTSIWSGRLITKTGRYKIFPIVGTLTMALGLYLLSTMTLGTSRLLSSIYMIVVGGGMGLIIQVMVIAVQNAVEHRDLGTATGAETFMRSIGGAFGVAVSGAILTNRLGYWLPRVLPAGASMLVKSASTLAASPDAVAKLPPQVKHGVLLALSRSIRVVFLFAVPLSLLAFAVCWFLKENPLRETAHVGLAEAGIEAGLTFEPSVNPEAAPELAPSDD